MTISSNISELYKTEVYLFLYSEDGCKRLFRNIGMYVCMYQTAVGHVPKVLNFYVARRDHLESHHDASLHRNTHRPESHTSLCEIYSSL